jgi:hypothetical protein
MEERREGCQATGRNGHLEAATTETSQPLDFASKNRQLALRYALSPCFSSFILESSW